MIPVCTAEQVRALDQAVIEGTGMPGQVLMEIAGRSVASTIQEQFPTGEIAILCGSGNNGGDGYVAARWLANWGRDVRIWALAPKTEDAALNRVRCERMDIPFLPLEAALAGSTIAVDALLGTGQRDAPRGEIAQAVEAIAGAPYVVAVDIPTGIHADTGQVLGQAVHAHITITLGRWKPGLLCAPGCDHAGNIYCADIGLDLARTVDPSLVQATAWLLEHHDVQRWRPTVPDDAAKWDRGHVAIRAGGGAAVLAAHGAFRGGAGLVTLLAPKSDWERFHGLWPEVILAEPQDLNPKRHNVVVVGPGLGTDAKDEVLALWNDWPGGVVADADALTILAANKDQVGTPGHLPRVITPHAAEAARLLGVGREDVEADRFGAIQRLQGLGTTVLKGPHTLIGPDRVWINPTGGHRLATAGTGDVLAGMIGGAMAAGVGAAESCAIAVWDHGTAGQRMPEGGTASDLLDALHPNPPNG